MISTGDPIIAGSFKPTTYRLMSHGLPTRLAVCLTLALGCLLTSISVEAADTGASVGKNNSKTGAKNVGINSGRITRQKTVWVIDQRHHSSGNLTLYFTPNELRIDKKNFGYFIVAKAPDWKVYCFRNDDKVICKLSNPAYLAEQGFRVSGPRVEEFPKVGDEFIGIIKTKKYNLQTHDDWVGSFPGIPSEIYDLINATAFYQTEPADGVVLKSFKHPSLKSRKRARLLSLDSENVTGIRIETIKITKVPYKPSYFSVPSNFRPTKFRVVLSSVENRREADSIIEQMGLGEKLGK
jgi:hypothetical protein